MTGPDRKALEYIMRRIDQMGGTACILSCDSSVSGMMGDAIYGLGETLLELVEKLDDIVNPPATEGEA